MKPKIFLFSLMLSISFIGSTLAESNDVWDAYKKGNYKAALNEWLPLAEKGSAEAQFNLAGMYAKGYGVVMDEKKSFDWYKKSAEQGHPKAQYNLGVMYIIGSGTPKSLSDAKHWFNLAGMFAKGYGVVMDEKKSFDWYKKAAEQGHPKAQYNLGVMYIIGSGTPKSLSDAKHWLRLAYDNGIEDVEILWNKYELWNY